MIIKIISLLINIFPKNGYLLHFIIAFVSGILFSLFNKIELGSGFIVGVASGKEVGDIARSKVVNTENLLDFIFTIAGGFIGVMTGLFIKNLF